MSASRNPEQRLPDASALPSAMRNQRVRLIFGALMLVLLLASLDQTIVSTALPTIVGDLGGIQHLSWVAAAYMLVLGLGLGLVMQVLVLAVQNAVERGETSMSALAGEFRLEPTRLASLGAAPVRRGYLQRAGRAGAESFAVSPSGRVALDEMIAARHHQLCRLLDGWSPESDDDLAGALDRLARALVAEIPGGR